MVKYTGEEGGGGRQTSATTLLQYACSWFSIILFTHLEIIAASMV